MRRTVWDTATREGPRASYTGVSGDGAGLSGWTAMRSNSSTLKTPGSQTGSGGSGYSSRRTAPVMAWTRTTGGCRATEHLRSDLANRGHEGQQVVEVVPEHVLDHPEVDVLVAVDDHVPESRHVPKRRSQGGGQPPRPHQEVEELAVRLGLAEALVGHDVRSHVQRGLDRDLQRVLDEAFLPDVRPHGLRPAE